MKIIVIGESILPKVLKKYENQKVLRDVSSPIRVLEYEDLISGVITTIKVISNVSDKSFRGQSPNKIYTTPDTFLKHSLSLFPMFMNDPEIEVILLV